MSDQSLKLIQKRLFQILVFLTPTQLAYHFWPRWSHVFGIRVDYLAPKIFLTDIIIFLLFFFWLIRKKTISYFLIQRKTLFIVFLATIFIFLNLRFAQSPAASLVKWLKIIELLFVLYFIKSQAKDVKDYLFAPIYYSIYAFSLIGILQFLFKSTLGGVIYYLGERSFDVFTPGIALINYFGKDLLRAYSTFSHPNSFAGYLLVSFSLLFFSGYIAKKKFGEKAVFYTIFLLAFVFTFSRTAFVVLLLIYLLNIFLKYATKMLQNIFTYILLFLLFVSLLTPLLSQKLLDMEKLPETLSDRAILAVVSGKMISQKFILGEGLNNFIVKLPDYSKTSRNIWTLQPVHNIFLLVLSETGIVGLLFFIYILLDALRFRDKKERAFDKAVNYSLLAILLTGLFDHFWLTLQQNLLMFAFVLGLAFKKRQ